MVGIFVVSCLAGLAALLVAGTVFRTHQRTVRLVLQPLVQKFGAELKRIGLWDEAVLFVHDVPVRVKVVRKTTSGRVLRLEAPIRDTRLRCRIRPLKAFDSVRRWFGGGVLTGQGAFDKVYFVEGSDADKLRETLDIHAQGALIALYSGIEQLESRLGQLRIDAAMPAETLTEHGLLLLERFLGIHSFGVDFVDGDESGPVRICSESSCPVCGEKISAGTAHVQCQGCQTPHHKECWKYAGGCAIFACGSRRQVKRKKQLR